MLAESGLNIVAAADMADGAQKVVDGGRRRQVVSVLVGYNTRLVVQGMSGSAGAFHAKQMVEYGTQRRRRRHARQGRQRRSPGSSRSRCSTPSTRRCSSAGANTTRHLRAAAVRRRLDPRGGRRGHRARSSRSPRASRRATWSSVKYVLERDYPDVVLDRPELPGRDHAGPVQDRHHAGLHPQAGRRRRRVALRHADLRGRAPADRARPRPVDRDRHRRRSGQGHRLHRRARAGSPRTRARRRSS